MYMSTVAAIAENGDLYTWGNNEDGRIGNGEYGGKNGMVCMQQTPYKALRNVCSVTMNMRNTAAITTNGDLYIWGNNEFGQIGDGTREQRSAPVKILSNVRSVSLNSHTTVAVTKNNELYAWGYNSSGEVGNGTIDFQLSPVKIMDNVRTATTSWGNTAALTTKDELYLWGGYGFINNDTKKDQLTPLKIMDNVRSYDFGRCFMALKKSGELYLWGSNTYGQIGNGTTDFQETPLKILDHVASVSLGEWHSAALMENGDLYTWGYDNSDNIILSVKPHKLQLTPEKVLESVSSVLAGSMITQAITTNGDLYLWGFNGSGSVGNGTTEYVRQPVKVLSNVQSCYTDGGTSAAITTNGDLYLWGSNFYGEICDGTSGAGNKVSDLNVSQKPTPQKLEIVEKPFIDVNPSDWFHDHVVYAYNRKLIYGANNTHFDPYATMTRCQLVSILYRLEGVPAVQGSSNFTDLEKGQYYVDAVTWAEQNGIVYGMNATTFDPHAEVTREQIVSFLYRYVEYRERNMESASLSGFSDYDQVSSYARPAMEWAVKHGIIYGTTSTTLSPQADAQRAQVAAFLYRLCLEYFR